MGGRILVGVRRRDGSEYLSERWTNPTASWFNDTEMYLDPEERLLQEYIADAANEPEGGVVPAKEVAPSEYGVLLVDMINRRVLSRQSYTQIGRLMVIANGAGVSSVTGEELELAKKMGALDSIQTISIRGPDLKFWGEPGKHYVVEGKEVSKVFALLEGPNFTPKDNVIFHFFWKLPDWEVDHELSNGVEHWEAIAEWVRANGWKSPLADVRKCEDCSRRVFDGQQKCDDCAS